MLKEDTELLQTVALSVTHQQPH